MTNRFEDLNKDVLTLIYKIDPKIPSVNKITNTLRRKSKLKYIMEFQQLYNFLEDRLKFLNLYADEIYLSLFSEYPGPLHLTCYNIVLSIYLELYKCLKRLNSLKEFQLLVEKLQYKWKNLINNLIIKSNLINNVKVIIKNILSNVLNIAIIKHNPPGTEKLIHIEERLITNIENLEYQLKYRCTLAVFSDTDGLL